MATRACRLFARARGTREPPHGGGRDRVQKRVFNLTPLKFGHQRSSSGKPRGRPGWRTGRRPSSGAGTRRRPGGTTPVPSEEVAAARPHRKVQCVAPMAEFEWKWRGRGQGHTGSRSARLWRSTRRRLSCCCLRASLRSGTCTVPLLSLSSASNIDLSRRTSDLTYLGQRASGAWERGWVGLEARVARSLGHKAHCAFGAADSSSVKPLLALAASFCWIRPLRFSAAKTRYDREHRRHGVAGEVGQGRPSPRRRRVSCLLPSDDSWLSITACSRS